MLPDFTLGVLSWGSPKTLRNSLASYEALYPFAGEKLIYFQEISPEDIRIAKEFGYQYEGTSKNVGISRGYANLLERASKSHFMFCENDWELIENPYQIPVILAIATTLLDEGIVDVFRLRSKESPGEPLYTRQFKGREYDKPTHLLDSIHWTDPGNFPEIAEVLKGVYVTSSLYANWTNNPTLSNTMFLREHILPRLEGDVEKSLQPWWEQQDFKVGAGNGLFMHNRLDR